MKRLGAVLITLSFVVLPHGSLGYVIHGHAGSHAGQDELWEAALVTSLAVAGIVLTWIPLRRDEPWAWWTLLGMFSILLLTRVITDPRCWVVYDPTQHGCHTFAVSMVFAAVGLGVNRLRK